MDQTTLLKIAYALLTLAFVSGIIASVTRIETDEDDEFAIIPGLLLVTIAANLGRHLIAPVNLEDPLMVFLSRTLFLVWPFSVLFLVLRSFRWYRLAGLTVSISGVFVTLIGVTPWFFNGGKTAHLARGIGFLAAGLALLFLGLTKQNNTPKLEPFMIASVFCAVAEGLVAGIGYLANGIWWPAITIYCALYVALIVLHARLSWTPRNNSPASFTT